MYASTKLEKAGRVANVHSLADRMQETMKTDHRPLKANMFLPRYAWHISRKQRFVAQHRAHKGVPKGWHVAQVKNNAELTSQDQKEVEQWQEFIDDESKSYQDFDLDILEKKLVSSARQIAQTNNKALLMVHARISDAHGLTETNMSAVPKRVPERHRPGNKPKEGQNVLGGIAQCHQTQVGGEFCKIWIVD